MALPILDGNQSATTLSTILSSGQHIPAHTVVSLGTQAITDMRGAVSGSVVSISNFPATQPVSIASVTIGNTVTIAGTVTANVPNIQVCTQGNFAQTSAIQTALGVINENNISQVLAVFGSEAVEGEGVSAFVQVRNQISGTVTIGSALPAGTNRIGVVTIGAGTVTIGAGTAQIGSVTASNLGAVLDQYEVNAQEKSFAVVASLNVQGYLSDSAKSHITNSVTIGSLPAISGTVTASISNSVTIASLPAISGTVTANIGNAVVIQVVNAVQDGDGTTFGVDRDFPVSGAVQIQAGSNQIGSVTANTFAVQGTAVTTSNFTSTTASTVLAGYNATREVLTIFNEGAGNLHICAGATCTTVQYQIRLSSGDYYEVPNHQTTITHSAVFATAGTARVTQVS